MICPACTEDLPSEDLARCTHCGERLDEREEVDTDGFGRDSIVVASLCCLATLVTMLLMLAA